MTAEQLLAAKASEAVKAVYGADVPAGSLQVQPTRKEFEGDYTLVVFPLLKISRQAPDATGNALGEWLLANCAEVSAYNSVKGFLNLSLSGAYWQEQLAAASSDPEFGQLPSTGRRIMVELSSPNTNKPLHLGHVRNNLLGASVSDLLKAAGKDVIAVGKIYDIFDGQGVTEKIKTTGNTNGIAFTQALQSRDFEGLAFVNLVDFDMLYGHRRDVAGYAAAATEFDRFLTGFLPGMREDDILMVTADHGCDPSYSKTTDHTREYVPWLVYGRHIRPGSLGTRLGFAAIARTVCDYLEVDASSLDGRSAWEELRA